MSDVENQPFFNIQRVYLKDMSLEQPNSPAIFLEQDMPSVEVEVDVKADRLAESVFEVVVSGTVTAKVKDKIAFLIEAKQAGIFDIRNIPDEQLDRSSASPARRSCSVPAFEHRRRDHACGLPADPPGGNQLPGAVRTTPRAASAAGRCRSRRTERHDAELTFHSDRCWV